MNKAVLSNRIYMNYNEDLWHECRKVLTYKVPSKIFGEPPEKICLAKKMGERMISLPIGCINLIPSDFEVVDKRSVPAAIFPKFQFDLRDSQSEIYDQVDDNCLIVANPAWGKTFTGIAIATKLKVKTLVLTHTVFLRDQWQEEIEHTLGITPGIIGGVNKKTVVDYKDHAITISNIQSFRQRADELKDEFGLIIIDECHHAPAKMFSETLNVMRARYKIGLTATLGRKDFLHITLPDFFGRTIYKARPENRIPAEIHMISVPIKFNSNMNVPWANRVTELTTNPAYISIVAQINDIYSKQGHNILTVCDRTEFLNEMHERFDDSSVLVIGETKDRELIRDTMAETEHINKVFGAISIFKEGISWNFLSCIILGNPINNDFLLEQLKGRIERKHPGKKQPVLVDIVLQGATARRQAKNRASFYARNGLKIKTINLT